jgi:hypothetical protein
MCALALAASALLASAAAASNVQDRYRAARQRASLLVKRMTLEEKLQLVHGTGFVRGGDNPTRSR